jgi:ubiquinone/menaquinone biosynthesis C-methylase UbiE
LAKLKNVEITYNVGPLESQSYKSNSFDVIALIFAHFPSDLKSKYHAEFTKLLKPGGKIIFEAFSKDHLDYSSKNPKVGGPKDIDILYSKREIESYFEGFHFDLLEKKEVDLSEGKYHIGRGSVIRFIGTKK